MNSLDNRQFVSYAVTTEGGLFLLGFFLAYVFGFPVVPHLALEPDSIIWGIAAFIPLASIVSLIELDRGRWLGRIYQSFDRIVDLLEPVVGKAIVGMGWTEIIVISALAGLGEEVLFRGVLQNWLGLIPAAFIFGALHALSTTYFVMTVLVGCYLGGLYIMTDNLWAPILTHGIYDAFALYLLRRIYIRRNQA